MSLEAAVLRKELGALSLATRKLKVYQEAVDKQIRELTDQIAKNTEVINESNLVKQLGI